MATIMEEVGQLLVAGKRKLPRTERGKGRSREQITTE
jgi:hypothetical protein